MATGEDFPDWPANVEPEALREIVRLGELQMEDALTLGIAADARANTQAYTMAAIAAVVAGVATAYANSNSHQLSGVVALYISAAGFLVAAAFAFYASRPVDWQPRGYQPRLLVDAAGDQETILQWTAVDIQRRLAHNGKANAITAFWTSVSLIAALVAAIGPAVAWGIYWHCLGQ